jgi:hypothetical protein
MTSFARRHNTFLASSLYLLKKYGAVYLPPEEYRQRLNAKENVYYRFLAKGFLERREPQFWDYHKKALLMMGYRLNSPKLVRGLLRELVQAAQKPIGAFSSLMRRR